MQQNQWEASRKEAGEASKNLLASMRVLFGENPLQDVLQHLLSRYKQVLGQETLTETALIALQKEQEQLMLVTKSEEMAQALEGLKAGETSLKAGDQLGARFFLESAQEEIRRRLASLQPETPQSIVEEAIAREIFSGTILTLRLRMATQQLPSGDHLKSAQDAVLKTVDHFLPVVLEQQTKSYRGNGKYRCQASPWGEALPLFEQGRKAAETAGRMLSQDRLRSALQNQGRAIIAWKQALVMLKKPPDESASPCQSQAMPKAQQENSSKEKSEASPQQQQGVSDVLRILQELNEEDLQPKTEQGIKKQVLRPW